MPYARAFLTLDMLKGFLVTGMGVTCRKSFPDDVELRTIVADPQVGGVWLIVESAAFPVVQAGTLLPIIDIEITLSPEGSLRCPPPSSSS